MERRTFCDDVVFHPVLVHVCRLEAGDEELWESSIMRSKALTEGTWMPETDGDWQAILVRIVAKSAMSMRCTWLCRWRGCR